MTKYTLKEQYIDNVILNPEQTAAIQKHGVILLDQQNLTYKGEDGLDYSIVVCIYMFKDEASVTRYGVLSRPIFDEYFKLDK